MTVTVVAGWSLSAEGSSMMENFKGSLEFAQGQRQSAATKRSEMVLQSQAMVFEGDGYIPRESEAPHVWVLVVEERERLACG